MEPGGDARWDEPPLGVVVPDDARDLERDVIAYHRELRALRRRRRLRRLMPAHAGIMPLIASILAVCLVAGMMLSVFTISPVEKDQTPRVYGTNQPARSGPATPAAPASGRSGGAPSGGPAGRPSGRPSATPREHASA